MTNFNLHQATGLTPQELSDVFQNNPRAYMAVRGAVSEKHLSKIVEHCLNKGVIDGYKIACGDMDKDFYLRVSGAWVSLECKNVEVVRIANREAIANYIEYLGKAEYISKDLVSGFLIETGFATPDIRLLSKKHLDELLRRLPQKLRESGLAKYQYSATQLAHRRLGFVSDETFICQFNNSPITIDFQRTRNSTDDEGNTRRNRYYRVGEVDIVGACLFSRTMEWEFLYARADSFDRHTLYSDRYSNKLQIKPGIWTSDLASLL